MSESPEVERSDQNPKGKTNLEKGAERPPGGKTDADEPIKVVSPEKAPYGNQMKNVGKSENIGTA